MTTTYIVKAFDTKTMKADELEVSSLKAARNFYMRIISKGLQAEIWKKGTADKLIANSNAGAVRTIAQ